MLLRIAPRPLSTLDRSLPKARGFFEALSRATTTSPTLSTPPTIPIAARLTQSLERWRQIGGAELIERGIEPEWKDPRSPSRLESERQPHLYAPQRFEMPHYLQLLQEELQE
jgi:hypothetical protein